jgi:hypothetical protein
MGFKSELAVTNHPSYEEAIKENLDLNLIISSASEK